MVLIIFMFIMVIVFILLFVYILISVYSNNKRGKTYIDNNGYRRFKDSNKLVHRYVMEKKLGRKLKRGEIVHHINRNKLDNSPENLEVFANQEEHQRHHNETDWLFKASKGISRIFRFKIWY